MSVDIRNFMQDILIAANGEEILAVRVLSPFRSSIGRDKKYQIEPGLYQGNSLLYKFDYEFDADYGGQDCHQIQFWTENDVFYISEYDGATWIDSIPRNPTDEAKKIA